MQNHSFLQVEFSQLHPSLIGLFLNRLSALNCPCAWANPITLTYFLAKKKKKSEHVELSFHSKTTWICFCYKTQTLQIKLMPLFTTTTYSPSCHHNTPTFISELFTVAKIWEQPKCPSVDEWIKK